MTAAPRLITSLTNDRVKAIRALDMRKERKETGLFVAEGAIEHFAFGRTDFDLSFNAELFGSRFVTSARFTGIALGVLPRYAVDDFLT